MKLRLLSLGLALVGMVFASSCSKESTLENVTQKSKVTTSSSEGTPEDNNAEKEEDGNVILVNALTGALGEIINVQVNGVELVRELGVREYTDFLVLETGTNVLDFTTANGDLIMQEVIEVASLENLMMVLNYADGEPVLDLVKFDANDFAKNTVNINDLVAETTNLINVVDLDNGDNLVLATELVNSALENSLTLVELPTDEVTAVVLSPIDIVQNVDLLGTALSLSQMAEELQAGDGSDSPLDELNPDDITDMLTLEDYDVEKLLGSFMDMLGLGGDADPIDVISEQLFDNSPMSQREIESLLMFENEDGEIELLSISFDDIEQ
ncbi:MAG: hypothetical protein ACJAY8_000419 [Sphingobacteriales bacterium]|jgi:hypothetical protein